MKKTLFYAVIISIVFFTACESSNETKEVTTEESGKMVKEPVPNNIDDTTKRTSVSIGSGGVDVKSKATGVKVDKNGIKVGTKDVNIEIKK